MKKQNIFCAFLSALLVTMTTHAASIKSTASEKKFEEVTLTQTTHLEDGGTTTNLSTVSHGLRKKKVFGLVNVSVYVAEFLAAQPTRLAKTEENFINSFADAQPVQLKLTMVRDLKGSDISKAFQESLEANKITSEKMAPELKEILDEGKAIPEFKNKDVFSLIATFKDGKATLHVQKPDGSIKSWTGSTIFVNQIFSIWFGTPSDPKLGDLKKTLMAL